jgi:thiol-disulfide isomerase/thioredoxin
MKKIFIIIAVLIVSGMSYAQPFNQEIESESGSPSLLGKINQDGLSQNSYADWFQKNKNGYNPKAEPIKALKSELADYTIQLFMGTWCGDSKREVPRFYKVLEEAQFPLERLTAIAVSSESETYKQSPGGEEEGLNIHRVPTFIIYKNGEEVDRIVESPVESLEEDLLSILNGNYTSNYHAVTIVNNTLQEMGVEKFSKKKKKIGSKIKEMTKNYSELNTYSYTLFRANKTEEAIEVAKLNTLLYPEEAATYLRVANQLKSTDRVSEAIIFYEKALEIDPENKKAKEGLEAINLQVFSKS